jgi:hypothetical protein
MGIHHACSYSKLLCKVCFGNVSESAEDEENKLMGFLGQINCSSNLEEFLNVDKLIPMARRQVWMILAISMWQQWWKQRRDYGENAFTSSAPSLQRCINGFVTVKFCYKIK